MKLPHVQIRWNTCFLGTVLYTWYMYVASSGVVVFCQVRDTVCLRRFHSQRKPFWMMEASFGHEEKVDQVADEDDEELLQPTWKKPTFGIQLETPTRHMTLSIAAVTKTKVKTVVSELDGLFNQHPFLDATYDVGNMLFPNPWNNQIMSSRNDIKQEIKTEISLSDRKGDIKSFEVDAGPMGYIPYIEEPPAIAEPKLSDSTDEEDPKIIDQKEDTKDNEILAKETAKDDKLEKIDDVKTSFQDFNSRKYYY